MSENIELAIRDIVEELKELNKSIRRLDENIDILGGFLISGIRPEKFSKD